MDSDEGDYHSIDFEQSCLSYWACLLRGQWDRHAFLRIGRLLQ